MLISRGLVSRGFAMLGLPSARGSSPCPLPRGMLISRGFAMLGLPSARGSSPCPLPRGMPISRGLVSRGFAMLGLPSLLGQGANLPLPEGCRARGGRSAYGTLPLPSLRGRGRGWGYPKIGTVLANTLSDVQDSRQILNLYCTYWVAADIEKDAQQIDFQRLGRKNDCTAPEIRLRRLLLFAVTLRLGKFRSSKFASSKFEAFQTPNFQTYKLRTCKLQIYGLPNCELLIF
jgi:hypothetical protein